MRFGIPRFGGSIRVPSTRIGWRRKIGNELKAGAKYAGIGAALSLGAEGASALVRHAEGPQMGADSQAVEFTDWGPSVFRVDMVKMTSDPKSKSLITWLLIAALVTLCLCIPFLRAFTIFNRHCAIWRFFGPMSAMCPSTSHHNTPHSIEDVEEQPAVSMEEYWRGMEDKSEVVNKTIAKEKRDIGDIV